MTANFSPLRPAIVFVAALALTLVAVASATAAPADDLKAAAQQQEAQRFAAGITGAARSVPGKKLNTPKRFRRALAAAGPRAERFALKTITVRFKPDKKKSRKASAAGSGGAVERMTVGRETATLPGGVKAEFTGSLRADAEGNVDADVEMKLTKGKETLIVRPDLDREPAPIKEIECPTAEGRLTLNDRYRQGQTIIVKKNGRFTQSYTERVTQEWSAIGQVGRDAKLASVETVSSSKIERYQRGSQVILRASGTTVTESENGGRVVGELTTSADVRIAGLTRAEDRKYEAEAARLLKSHEETKDAIASAAKSSWINFEQNQWKWYQLPNYCAALDLDPNWVNLDEGDSMSAKGTMRSQRFGGDAAGAIVSATPSIGSFSIVKSSVDLGAPAEFSAVGGNPGSGSETVRAEVVATSTAGRAMQTFVAEAQPVKVPKKFGGWVEAETTGMSVFYRFDAYLEFELQYVNTGPNGFATAWYELTAIPQMHPSINSTAASGCRIEASASSGAVINSGDIELRRMSADAPWKYAIHADFSIPDQHFGPVDCPPGSGMPEWEGDISNYIYTAPNGEWRELWSGSTATDWRMIESGVTDVNGFGLFPTVAEWGLLGTF